MTSNAGESAEKPDYSYIIGGEVKWESLWIKAWKLLTKLNMCSQIIHLSSGSENSFSHRNLYVDIPLFLIWKTNNNPNILQWGKILNNGTTYYRLLVSIK